MTSTSACPHANPALRGDIAAPPKFMEHLPIDKRGYPVPWFVRWIDGEPEFRAMNPHKFHRAIEDKLCWICGGKLFGEQVFCIGQCARSIASAVNRRLIESADSTPR